MIRLDEPAMSGSLQQELIERKYAAPAGWPYLDAARLIAVPPQEAFADLVHFT